MSLVYPSEPQFRLEVLFRNEMELLLAVAKGSSRSDLSATEAVSSLCPNEPHAHDRCFDDWFLYFLSADPKMIQELLQAVWTDKRAANPSKWAAFTLYGTTFCNLKKHLIHLYSWHLDDRSELIFFSKLHRIFVHSYSPPTHISDYMIKKNAASSNIPYTIIRIASCVGVA